VHPTWDAAWAAALDDLELTLEQTERLLGGEPQEALDAAAWVPPELSGSLPVELAARAHVLVARQRELMGRTAAAISATRRGVADLDKVNVFAGAERAALPVYLDLRA
jgi:hypothetical protein